MDEGQLPIDDKSIISLEMPMCLSEVLLHIDSRFTQVTKKEENLEVIAAVEKVLQDVVIKIGETNQLYVNHIIPSGSTYEGTKILLPDEFDLMVCMDDLSNQQIMDSKTNIHNWSESRETQISQEMMDVTTVDTITYQGEKKKMLGQDFEKYGIELREQQDEQTKLQSCMFNIVFCDNLPGHAYLEVVDEHIKDRWKDYIIQNSKNGDKLCLDATNVKSEFSQLVEQAAQDVVWPKDLKFKCSNAHFGGIISFKSPDEMKMKWKDTLDISVDIVPCVSLKQCGSIDHFIHNEQLSKVYPKEIAGLLYRLLEEEGLLAVGRIDVFWRISWSLVEMRLMRHLRDTVPNALACYRIVKYFNEAHFVSDYGPPRPTTITSSYPLKNILFHIWAKHAGNIEAWTDPAVCDRVLEMLKHLANAFKTSYLSCFFMPQNNLFKPGEWNAPAAEATEKLIVQLLEKERWTTEDIDKFHSRPVQIIVSKPKKKLSDYKIRRAKPGEPGYDKMPSVKHKLTPSNS